jgi:ABC-type multidrug transport system ATPase subunit
MIRLERFEKRYGKVRAVERLDLDVASGESFALLGPNGSGKTTIIRALVGLHRPSAGRVLIDGVDVVKSPDRAKRRFAYVPQRMSLPGTLTAREILALFAKLRGADWKRVEEMLETFALSDDADRRTAEFSGGMLQRLGLAIAFLRDVPLYVLDEPTTNLDLLGVDRLQHLLAELKKKRATIVFSSHMLQSAMRLADRVAVLVDGRLVKLEEAPVFRSEVTRQTVVRVVLNRATDGAVEAARAAGAELTRRNARQVWFRAMPQRRLEIIRAIEHAGATVEEVHTETPDWEALIRTHYNGEEPTP